MSAFGGIADIGRTLRNVRFGSKADMSGSGLLSCEVDLNPISPGANPCCNTSLKIGVVLSLGWAMRRRSRASSKLANARSRKAKTVRRSSSSASRQETEVVRLTHELKEAHEQQAATSEVLEIIGH